VTEAATFLLVGCGHWGSPGLDLRQVEFDDMLSPRRQAEMAIVLDRLARFRPTKIAVEIEEHAMPAVQQDYEAWRSGSFALTANERHQLGFRLAGMVGHERVFGIDWHDHTREIGWDRAVEFAMANGQRNLLGDVLDAIERPAETAREDAARVRSQSVLEQLRATNDPDALAPSHLVYMEMSRIGEGANYIGADVIVRWYERNMKMFVNLARLVDTPDERILLVVGGGHLPLLTHFLAGAGFRVESALDYLRE
jgi:hypothetical protein